MRFLSSPPTPPPARAGHGTAPDGLPEPRPYGHLTPDDGACLMETAALLAAEPFTDCPRGTDPALAALARAVNDAVDDTARHRLRPLAADLATARPAERSFTPRLVTDALRAAQAVRPSSRLLTWRAARCRRRAMRLSDAPPGRVSGVQDTLWWHGPGRHHLEHALRVVMDAPDAQHRLISLLRGSVAAATGRTDTAHTDAPSATVG